MTNDSFIRRFSSRQHRLDHVFLRDRLANAHRYLRIAGYFRSSIFELISEEVDGIGEIKIICNSDLDPRDIAIGKASKVTREAALKEKWNEGEGDIASLLQRPKYQRLYDLLKSGRVQVKVVPADSAPFVHGKAGIIEQKDGSKSAFVGSLNETRQGWGEHYEIVWEDTSTEGVDWVREEFDYLWSLGVDLPEAIIEEIGRCARKREVELSDLAPSDVAAAAMVESPIYRKGEELKPWQRAFVSLFLKHRELYGCVRLLLADEVGVGKTLSMAASAMLSCLLDDGPALILTPATLCDQWQVELKDKLGIPSAVWLSNRKMWRDHNGHLIRTRGAEDIVRCPFRIGIVSTGLLFQRTDEYDILLNRRYGTVILDEAHKARMTRGITGTGSPTNLLEFMRKVAERSKHVLLGTATPVQTHIEELWDLLDILNRGADFVLGRPYSTWANPDKALPVITGKQAIADEQEAWELLRNPLPPAHEGQVFDHIRSDLGIHTDQFFTDKPVTDLDQFTRDELHDLLETRSEGLGFFQLNNPILRHTVLRKRQMLEELGLIDKIPVDIWPSAKEPLGIFDGNGLPTTPEFDRAYEAAMDFTSAIKKKGAGFMENMMLQRICSSIASGISTAKTLLKSRAPQEDSENDLEFFAVAPDIQNESVEASHLRRLIECLEAKPTDPKLDAVLHFLLERGWLDLGCIIFSQYYDTANWVAQCLTERLPKETVALYAGAGKSGLYFGCEWRSIEREAIKCAVRDRKVRLVVATDAACEGLNLQTLGTLINVDLPWNPSRLEQRIGRIKRFGQRRDRVDMLNLVYNNTRDQVVYDKLSQRMKDRYDLFGSLPDTIEDEWIDNEQELEKRLKDYTVRHRQANAFSLRYQDTVIPDEPSWELCEKVLSRRNVINQLSKGW